ncbi:MAG TPA: D-glycero-beta-D-manno-heptose-7-phosphate kinase [Pyrinomonadaceae bacterium]
MQYIKEHIDKFSNVKVLIVGDVMLDRYWWGSVTRISPEAPVPVVKLEKMSAAAGGAANVAANVVGLGARPFMFGLVGDDAEGRNLAEILKKNGISADHLLTSSDRQTSVKTRIVAHSQQVVRVDDETNAPISLDEAERVFQALENILEEADVVIVSDYAKGFLIENLLMRLITTCQSKGKKILIDPKGKDYGKYRGATLLTPNQKEATEACGFEDFEADLVEKAGKTLLERIAAESVLITQGEKGMSLFEKDGTIHRFEALARKVYDVTGAGDTVIATLAVAIGAGLNFYEAARIANIAAGLVVEQIGTTAITRAALETALDEKSLSVT